MSKYSYSIATIDLTSTVVDFPVEQEGQVITHLTGDATVTIKLNDRTEDPIPLSPRDVLPLPDGLTFKGFFVSGSAGGGIVTLLVARPKITVDAGQVYIAGSILSSPSLMGYDEKNGHQYGMYSIRQAATAAQAFWAGIRNPAASGKVAVIKGPVYAMKESAIASQWIWHGPGDGSAFTVNTNGAPVRSDHPVSTIKSGAGTAAVAAINTYFTGLLRHQAYVFTATNPEVFKLEIPAPIVVPPGGYYMFFYSEVNKAGCFYFDWIEFDED